MTATPKPPSMKDHGLSAQIESSDGADVKSMKERGPSEDMLKKASEITTEILSGFSWTQRGSGSPLPWIRTIIATALASQQADHDKLTKELEEWKARTRSLNDICKEQDAAIQKLVTESEALTEKLGLARECLEFYADGIFPGDESEFERNGLRGFYSGRRARECLKNLGNK